MQQEMVAASEELAASINDISQQAAHAAGIAMPDSIGSTDTGWSWAGTHVTQSPMPSLYRPIKIAPVFTGEPGSGARPQWKNLIVNTWATR